MSKRFTDTDKWKREWFTELDPKAKLVWFYLLDQCDHRGVWFRNFRLMSEQLGFKVTAEQLEDWFGNKLRHFDEDKYFVPSFVEFQYGTLNPSNNAHKSVITLLELLEKLAPHQPQISPSRGAQDKDKDKDKEERKGGVGEKQKPKLPEIAQLWNECAEPSLPRVLSMSKNSERYQMAVTRWTENPDREYWIQVIDRVNSSDFCLGKVTSKDGRTFVADIEFLVRPDTHSKIMEGKYDNRKSQQASLQLTKTLPPEVEAVFAEQNRLRRQMGLT